MERMLLAAVVGVTIAAMADISARLARPPRAFANLHILRFALLSGHVPCAVWNGIAQAAVLPRVHGFLLLHGRRRGWLHPLGRPDYGERTIWVEATDDHGTL